MAGDPKTFAPYGEMMNLQLEKQWWNGKARAKLPDAVLRDARRWQSSRHSETVQQLDRRSRLKVSMLFIGFLLIMLIYSLVPIHSTDRRPRHVAAICVVHLGPTRPNALLASRAG
jgi:hypothetical protein